ncbi:MAG: YbhB/YbcL family Raf kinase inhibitor-like protein [Blastocatellales bacterium]
MNIQILSSAFSEGESIPVQYTCDGDNFSPPLRWGGIPKDSQSLALVCEDPDAPSGTFVHWVLFNLPPIVSNLPEALPAGEELEETNARQGRNDFGEIGYGGPCPPPGNPHRYFFRFYALDTELRLRAGATRGDLDNAMRGHILAEGHLMGTYQRKAGRAARR